MGRKNFAHLLLLCSPPLERKKRRGLFELATSRCYSFRP
jgi:hypothetical protein